ncbi:hypothetical protein BC835DRAFT_1420619 [Cytidiella melzeri]|nr:hypothetical protein BC835DRAFT_1420619 [Cytidiella melzeri]
MGNYQSGPKDNNQHVPGSFRQEPCAKNQVMKGKTTTNIVQQTIIFDVSQPLDEVQAPHDTVKSTAIALVKVDSTFLPRSTIGATHWVAYGMSKGRVRVISRSSSDRTLLQLPPLFPTSVTDDVAGKIVLCVLPANALDPLHAVKWHPLGRVRPLRPVVGIAPALLSGNAILYHSEPAPQF